MDQEMLAQPDGAIRLGDFLKQGLSSPRWTEFRAAVAFVKYSGTKHIHAELREFARRAAVRISVGIDSGGTSVEGLIDLLDCVRGHGELWVFHNANPSTFHPKVYLFKDAISADVFVGSGNMTEGGLYTNYEAGVRLKLDRQTPDDARLLAQIETALDAWSSTQDGLCYRIDSDLIKQLTEQENVPTEADSWETEERSRGASQSRREPSIFKRVAVPRAPVRPRDTPDLPDEATREESEEIIVELPEPTEPQLGQNQVFLMTLQRTDVGVGQVTAGASRRSPEIFIPLAARDADPDFWGWPGHFTPDPTKPGKMDRFGVKMRIGTTIFDVNMMTWPDKHDFRLRSEQLRSAGNEGDILYMERSDGASGFSYYVEVIPKGSARYSEYLAHCANAVHNSRRLWGYL
jgi:HKD family nuclease